MPLQILTVEKDGGDGIMVTFSDGTIAGYVAEELASLRPIREKRESRRARAVESPPRAGNRKYLAPLGGKKSP
jgi:hypothetical protein